jgi:hypothetical protein
MDYKFESISRIGNDDTYLSQTDIQNVGYANYMLQNYFAADCSMKSTTDLATSQPGVFFSGGNSISACGSNVDDSSKLLIGTMQTHPQCKLDMFQRPFLTVPYLGRGSVNPVMESQILQGESLLNKRTATNLGETSTFKQTPLLQSVRSNIENRQRWNNAGQSTRDANNDVPK